MATELTSTISVTHSANGVDFAETVVSSTEDLTGNGITAGVLSVATSAAAVPLGGVSTAGVAYFKNLDATNYLEIGWDDSGFVAAAKLLPGQVALIPLVNAPWARANTGACLMQYRIFER
jgi:hypothetical protein